MSALCLVSFPAPIPAWGLGMRLCSPSIDYIFPSIIYAPRPPSRKHRVLARVYGSCDCVQCTMAERGTELDFICPIPTRFIDLDLTRFADLGHDSLTSEVIHRSPERLRSLKRNSLTCEVQFRSLEHDSSSCTRVKGLERDSLILHELGAQLLL